jgi:hypothetical protein
MKITKELYNAAYLKNLSPELVKMPNYAKYCTILSEITKKEADYISVYAELGYHNTMINFEKYLDEFYKLKEDIINKYNLIPLGLSTIDYNSSKDIIRSFNGVYLGDNILIIFNSRSLPSVIYYIEDSVSDTIEIFKMVRDIYVPILTSERSSKRCVRLLTIDPKNRNITEKTITIENNSPINQEKIYNSDLPHKEIIKNIKSDQGGFFIFHGIPGCGKSTYIKYLIDTMSKKDINFYIVPQEIMLGYPELFRKFLLENTDVQNKIFILEDCERLIQDRTKGSAGNSMFLSEILNLSDGILGDLLKAKFICTFNCDLTKIDPALLRKGRLLMKYEFKPLVGDRLYELAKELNLDEVNSSGMTLAELYNAKITNEIKTVETKKIGF